MNPGTLARIIAYYLNSGSCNVSTNHRMLTRFTDRHILAEVHFPGDGEWFLQEAIRQAQQLQDKFCRGEYSLCKILDDAVFGYRDRVNSQPCFETLGGICDTLCGGDLLARPPFNLEHSEKGLFQRFEEYGIDELNQELNDQVGRENHLDLFDRIQRALRDLLGSWNQQNCQAEEGDITELMETAEDWGNVTLPDTLEAFDFRPEICLPIIGCFRLPLLPPVYFG